MTPKTYHRFKTMGYDLNCKICDCPVGPTDEVESKASGGSGPKLYHGECYDDFHLSFEYDEDYLKSCSREDLEDIYGEFDLEAPKGLSNSDLIDLIMIAEIEWLKNEKKQNRVLSQYS